MVFVCDVVVCCRKEFVVSLFINGDCGLEEEGLEGVFGLATSKEMVEE